MLTPTKPRRLRLLVDEELRGALRCLGALAAVTAFGTVGFTLIEQDWSIWKSLFFTLITITTVGYGDQGLSESGEVFAAILLLLGIGTATYSLTSLVQIAINYQTAWKRKMQRQINRLTDHFIICGFGRIGLTVAEQLKEADIPFVVIDLEMAKVETAVERGFLAIQGNSADDETLEQARIADARGIICAINSDAENVFVTLCAREMNPKAFIASRASTEGAARKMQRAGATLVVSPYTSAGNQIADAVLRPSLADYLSKHRGGEIELSELTIDHDSWLAGLSVREVGERFDSIVFVAAEPVRSAPIVRPGGNHTFTRGETITVAGNRKELERFLSA